MKLFRRTRSTQKSTTTTTKNMSKNDRRRAYQHGTKGTPFRNTTLVAGTNEESAVDKEDRRKSYHVASKDAPFRLPKISEKSSVDDTDSTTTSLASSLDEELAELFNASSSLSSLEDQGDEPTFVNDDSYFDVYNYNFHKALVKIFEGKADKTVLLAPSQMEEVMRAVNEDYTEMLLAPHPTARHGVEVHMQCASHVLGQFWAAQVDIQQTRMASTTTEMIFFALEDYLFPRLVDQFYPLAKLRPEAAASVITWICDLQKEMQEVVPDVQMRGEWDLERSNMLRVYLDRAVRHEMQSQLQELLRLNSEDDIRRGVEDYLVTGLPEAVTYMCNQQVRIAAERLPTQYTEDIVAACNEELAAFVSDWTLKISSGWSDMGSDFLCTIINDASRLVDYCEARHEDYLTRPDLMERGEDLLRDLAELSLHATRFLCERIMQDLREPESILTSVGDDVWQNPETHSAVDRTVATFKDYFTDIEQWLVGDYYFPKVLKNCFDLALQTYLESFFGNTMARGGADPALMATELLQDFLRFVVFFNGELIGDYHGRAGFYSHEIINDRMRILQHMSALLEPSNRPEDLKEEVKAVLSSFSEHESGGPAVLHLVGLRKRQGPLDSVKWLKLIAGAKKELSQEAAAGGAVAPALCPLPDVRNSRFLQRVRPPLRSEIPRQISKGSLPFAQSTTRLMQRPTGLSAVAANASPAKLFHQFCEHGQRQFPEPLEA
jgi:hypothetical protein